MEEPTVGERLSGGMAGCRPLQGDGREELPGDEGDIQCAGTQSGRTQGTSGDVHIQERGGELLAGGADRPAEPGRGEHSHRVRGRA